MLKRHLILFVLIISFSCENQSEADSSMTRLQETIASFNSAFANADVERLGQLTSGKYVHTNGSWKSFGRDQWLEYMNERKSRIEAGDLKLLKYEMEDVSIVLHTTSAFVTGKFVIEQLESGEHIKKEIRVSNFWIIENGAWKRAGFHDTPINLD